MAENLPESNKKKKEPKSDFRKTYLSDRGLFDYMERLEISEKDLDDPESLILDLGSGIQQRLAKEVKYLGLKSKIVSVDPRLSLSEEEDLSKPATEKQKRLEGRKNPEPSSVAAISEALPFKNNTFKHIYALFSVPYYLNNPEEIIRTVDEVLRILKPEGTFRAYPIPILEEQLETIAKILGKKNVEFEFKEMIGEDWLLILKKK